MDSCNQRALQEHTHIREELHETIFEKRWRYPQRDLPWRSQIEVRFHYRMRLSMGRTSMYICIEGSMPYSKNDAFRCWMWVGKECCEWFARKYFATPLVYGLTHCFYIRVLGSFRTSTGVCCPRILICTLDFASCPDSAAPLLALLAIVTLTERLRAVICCFLRSFEGCGM